MSAFSLLKNTVCHYLLWLFIANSQSENPEFILQIPLLNRPPTDGGRLRDSYHNSTNSILQQLKRKIWTIADVCDALFQISSMTDSLK